jgi:hypothetical protein
MTCSMPILPYLIANPIYDAVFKALLADLDLARQFLSVILGLEIVNLRFTSQEAPAKSPVSSADSPAGVSLSCGMRLDFCAVIRTGDGQSRQVLIELQKSRFSGDILRFRRYLAERYTTLEEIVHDDGSIRAESLPILCIYLMGFEIDARIPVVTRVERRYVDAVSGGVISLPNATRPAWIEGLTHDACFVQIPRIRGGGSNEPAADGTALERLISVFDQTLQVEGDAHRLDYAGGDGKLGSDKLLRRVLRRLHKLQADPEMERIMSAEDAFELEQKRILEDFTKELRVELAESEERREESDRRREESDRRREESDRLREESDRLREESDRHREEAEREIARLRKLLADDGSP